MKFYGTQDLQQNELQNAVVHKGTSYPSTPIVGQLFERTDMTPKKVFIFLGVGVAGTDSGWFCLNYAYYSA
jgi:hypothetical protein